MSKLFNISLRKVGGLTFLKLGRINISWSVSRALKVKPEPVQTVFVARPSASLTVRGYQPSVAIVQGGRIRARRVSPHYFASRAIALAFALDACRSVGLAVVEG
ncbi:hypothetical protein [Microvirga brassicacearum]|uniref:Uncharacterized protein n=1 Tax=Microvirga brassicacearum TaxID=2580413 RepID=A0A5N3PH64_9HYPH|nr:hypothetical protein [Microvirga brassicacearum]KAB0269050.1 hypothetical protein FEZ63_02780 [Microvirga brassicacearum]